ncbi:unnamed protein product [Blepharisma stoltei]|uniref:Uncharacterized protein n=1 Tax=Blepharisma stoltei TaxID=1481888 RepID=A0AAU9IKI3_9CILI|nr:unnamed protein product [Blepharisma stoltei]
MSIRDKLENVLKEIQTQLDKIDDHLKKTTFKDPDSSFEEYLLNTKEELEKQKNALINEFADIEDLNSSICLAFPAKKKVKNKGPELELKVSTEKKAPARKSTSNLLINPNNCTWNRTPSQQNKTPASPVNNANAEEPKSPQTTTSWSKNWRYEAPPDIEDSFRNPLEMLEESAILEPRIYRAQTSWEELDQDKEEFKEVDFRSISWEPDPPLRYKDESPRNLAQNQVLKNQGTYNDYARKNCKTIASLTSSLEELIEATQTEEELKPQLKKANTWGKEPVYRDLLAPNNPKSSSYSRLGSQNTPSSDLPKPKKKVIPAIKIDSVKETGPEEPDELNASEIQKLVELDSEDLEIQDSIEKMNKLREIKNKAHEEMLNIKEKILQAKEKKLETLLNQLAAQTSPKSANETKSNNASYIKLGLPSLSRSRLSPNVFKSNSNSPRPVSHKNEKNKIIAPIKRNKEGSISPRSQNMYIEKRIQKITTGEGKNILVFQSANRNLNDEENAKDKNCDMLTPMSRLNLDTKKIMKKSRSFTEIASEFNKKI